MIHKPELGALHELQIWREDTLRKIAAKEEALLDQLVAVVPANLAVWLKEAGERMVRDIIRFGSSSRKYWVNQGDPYGYTDLKEFANRFAALRLAWERIIWIETDWNGDECFELSFQTPH